MKVQSFFGERKVKGKEKVEGIKEVGPLEHRRRTFDCTRYTGDSRDRNREAGCECVFSVVVRSTRSSKVNGRSGRGKHRVFNKRLR